MKKNFLIACILGIVVFGAVGFQPAGADAEKIAAVKAGTLKTAYASWWGFNAEDSTQALQNAIDSGVPRLIVDRQAGDWVVSKTLNLVSNQEIVLEKDVVIQARKGFFKGQHESLIKGSNVRDVTLTGKENSVLRMQRSDYADPALYRKAEWRHGISFIDSENIIVRGLTVCETGGDGLYLGASRSGFNKNVLVEDVVFDSNHRLGMGVISVEDLIIRRCQFIRNRGTSPAAGIDFEPNYATQRIVNCVVEDSAFKNNAIRNIHLYLVNLDDTSLPVSITFKRCSAEGTPLAMSSTVTYRPENAAKGQVNFEECRFSGAVSLRNRTVGSATYLFRNCFFRNRDSVITLPVDDRVNNAVIGGITFQDSVASMRLSSLPIARPVKDDARITDSIQGTLYVEHAGQKTLYDLSALAREE